MGSGKTMRVQLLDHDEKSWERVVQVIDDAGKAYMVYFSWDSNYGYEIENYNKLPDWLVKQFVGMPDLAQYLDEQTYAAAYNKIEVDL